MRRRVTSQSHVDAGLSDVAPWQRAVDLKLGASPIIRTTPV